MACCWDLKIFQGQVLTQIEGEERADGSDDEGDDQQLARVHAVSPASRRVGTVTSPCSVRCTGHLSAISSSLARCSALELTGQRNRAHQIDRFCLPSFRNRRNRWRESWRAAHRPDAVQRQFLQVGIHAQRHRRAGAQCCRQQLIRRQPQVIAANGARLVGDRAGAPPATIWQTCPSHVFGHARTVPSAGRRCCRRQVTGRPRGDQLADVATVFAPRQQVVGTIERNEAFRMLAAS